MSLTPDAVAAFLRESATRPLKAGELAKALGVSEEAYQDFLELLRLMEETGALYRVKGQRYAAPDKINLATGRLAVTRGGAGFVVTAEGTDDVFVPPHHLGSATHDDLVVARIERRRRGQRPEGRVIKVLERSRETIVGIYKSARNFGFVTPGDRKLTRDFFVPPGSERGAADGEVVVLRVTFWGDEHKGPAGDVERVIGPVGAPGVDVLAVMYGHELPVEFPPEVAQEAREVHARGIAEADLEGREDLRSLAIFTIDPADARDHDDALSLRPRGEGVWEVGVHIADVSHYVREGSALDQEALERATSVYLVDRVVSMLPEELSADLCSLREGEDRLAVSLLIDLSEDGGVRAHRLVRSVIRCRRGLSYEDAQAILDGDGAAEGEIGEALPQLLRLARALRSRRRERGSLDFDLPEARVVLGPEGDPIDIQRVLRLEAHLLIEDFMLLANETLAALAVDRIPFLYRVHGSPTGDRLEQLRAVLEPLGHRLPSGSLKSKHLQRILDRARGKPGETLISTAVLRSMRRAEYSSEAGGHFGLAAEHYTHFTSPIRRYPDLMVHRLAKRAFVDGKPIPPSLGEALPHVAQVASARERVADEAQRDSVDLKKVEFMERHLGDTFDGTISGVTSFGFFVLLDTLYVEGLVHVNALDDDYYIFIEEQYALMGERTRRRFQLGDTVRVRVAAVDREQRQIDFALHEGE